MVTHISAIPSYISNCGSILRGWIGKDLSLTIGEYRVGNVVQGNPFSKHSVWFWTNSIELLESRGSGLSVSKKLSKQNSSVFPLYTFSAFQRVIFQHFSSSTKFGQQRTNVRMVHWFRTNQLVQIGAWTQYGNTVHISFKILVWYVTKC